MPKTEAPFISKSKYLNGLQCNKLLWYYYNRKKEIPEPDAGTQAIFDQGHLVGQLARSLFPGGVDVAPDIHDLNEVVLQTREALKLRKPLFESAFRYRGAFARADILVPASRGAWDLIEIKSSTTIKEENLYDLAFQYYTYRGAGLRIRRTYLMHINNKFVRKGVVKPERLYTKEDLTREVKTAARKVGRNIPKMVSIIRRPTPPDIKIGSHCNSPHDCPLQEMCWSFLPERNVFSLYSIGNKGFDLLSKGITTIRDIPDEYRLTDRQRIQIKASRSRRPHIDHDKVRAFLESLEYPLHFLDFETFQTVIPLFDGVRPYQQVPFQFSLHVVKRAGVQPEHHSFLADGNVDPRREFLLQLKKLLGEKGSIIAYNASFELTVLNQACQEFKQLRWFRSIKPRVVDLLVPFRSFWYYHPKQDGSASIKSVLPALTGKSYEGMGIADGGTASLEYLRVTFGDSNDQERAKIRKQLEEYCELDTFGMIKIVNELEGLVNRTEK